MAERHGPLGVAVIGLGIGEQHARAYSDLPECRLRRVYDIDLSRMAQAASELGCEAARSYEEILKDEAVDLVSIASFDDAHYHQVIAALGAGKHVFVEKPLCRSDPELRRIKDAWRRQGRLHLRSNLVLRAAPLYQWLREAIRSGKLGKIYAFDGDYLYGRLHKITDGWRKDVERYSVMQGGGVHLVDLMLWSTGEKPETVHTVGNRISTEGTDVRYPDFMSATFLFPSTMIGRITANFGCVHRHQHVVRVFGTEGTFIYDDRGARIHKSREPEVPSRDVAFSPLPESKGALIPGFVREITGAEFDRVAVQHEFDVISACIAADAALQCGHTVNINYA